jgi:hypothetical protein
MIVRYTHQLIRCAIVYLLVKADPASERKYTELQSSPAHPAVFHCSNFLLKLLKGLYRGQFMPLKEEAINGQDAKA